MDAHTRRDAAVILMAVAALCFFLSGVGMPTRDGWNWQGFGLASASVAAALLVAP